MHQEVMEQERIIDYSQKKYSLTQWTAKHPGNDVDNEEESKGRSN